MEPGMNASLARYATLRDRGLDEISAEHSREGRPARASALGVSDFTGFSWQM
jgi:hypothetical protein